MAPTFKVPAVTTVPPVWVAAAARLNVPVPFFSRRSWPAPELVLSTNWPKNVLLPLPPLALPPTVKVLTPVALLAIVPAIVGLVEARVLTTPLRPLRSRRPPLIVSCIA